MQILLDMLTMMNRSAFLILVRNISIYILCGTLRYSSFVSVSTVFMFLCLQVTGVMTQGRGDGKEWVTSFKVSYSMDDYNEAYVTDQYGNHRVRKSGIREYV